MQVTYILLKVEHSKPIENLTDFAAGRLYTLDKVNDVTAIVLDEYTAKESILLNEASA